jgi:hypothetical protein
VVQLLSLRPADGNRKNSVYRDDQDIPDEAEFLQYNFILPIMQLPVKQTF